MEIVGHKKAAGAPGASRGKRGVPLFYMEIQPKALATELARMIAAKMGHR